MTDIHGLERAKNTGLSRSEGSGEGFSRKMKLTEYLNIGRACRFCMLGSNHHNKVNYPKLKDTCSLEDKL